MKHKILKLSTVILLFAFISAGCKKDENDHTATGIIGEWELLQHPETCAGFGNVMLEITSDSVFKKYTDGELTLESTFTIKTGTMDYDTISFHNPDVDFSYQFIYLLGNDTIHLDAPILTSIPRCNYFKRKK